MKRFFLVLLSLALFALPALSAAEHSDSLASIQRFLETRSPDLISRVGMDVEIVGEIINLYSCGVGNHYEMVLSVDDPAALVPLAYDRPVMVVHFRLHVDPVPFKVGETVSVSGLINALYSSVMIPVIDAETINGSGDF